jgi:hypothetical protein
MNKREQAKKNEFLLLEIINVQRWVREYELSLLSGLSIAMVRRTCMRLAEEGDIFRDRLPSGFFVRLTKNGAAKMPEGQSSYKFSLPKSWRHDCLAIQALVHLKQKLEAIVNLPGFEASISTEAQIRLRQQSGKIHDGLIELSGCILEVEWAKKVGEPMRYQSQSICDFVDEGFDAVVAYPFTPNLRGTLNHERAVTNSLRSICGKGEMRNVKLLRCYFNSLLDMQHVRVSKFEEIPVPIFQLDARSIALSAESEELEECMPFE